MEDKDVRNPFVARIMLENEKSKAKLYYKENPGSLIPLFEKELKDLGFEFETSSQTFGFVPKYKNVIVPIALKYYQLAKEMNMPNEQNHFIGFFRIKGLDEIVPLLLSDFYSDKTTDLTRWLISDCIYQIKSRQFIKEYLNIASNRAFGLNRQMIILLLGKLKDESTVPTLIALLDDEEVRLQAICALSEFKRKDFCCYFERFQSSTNAGWRKYSKKAIQKLDS